MTTGYENLRQEADQTLDDLREEIRNLTDDKTRLETKVATMSGRIALLSARSVASKRKTAPEVQIVDLAGIARHMHVERFTPQQWRQRYADFPPVDFPDIKEPLWYASTIRAQWAALTGRLWCDTPTAQHAVACDIPHFPYEGRNG